jgi:exodeoxyribonuclease III
MLIRVMTYNVLDGGFGREQHIFDTLQSVQPDIVILQEVFASEFVEKLGNFLDMEIRFGDGNRQRHVALLSRFPILSSKSHHPFPPIWRNTIQATLEYHPGKKLHVLGVHPMANLAVLFECWRWWEAQYNIRIVEPLMSEPCLIAGDLNAIAPSDPVDIHSMPKWLKWAIRIQGNRIFRFSVSTYLKAGFTDSFRSIHPNEKGYTLPAPNPNARLDYILINDVLRPLIRKCYVVNNLPCVHQASDHYPVVAEFKFQQGEHGFST